MGMAEGNIPAREKDAAPGLHRGLRAGRVHEGPPGTWEIRTSPRRRGEGHPESKPMARRRRAPRRMGSKQGVQRGTAERRATEAKRDGRTEVGAAHSSDEPGEPTQGTRRSEGAVGVHGIVGGNDDGDEGL